MPPLLFCATNRRTSKVLGRRIQTARSVRDRLRGLLGRERLESGEGLWIEPCASVHMFFMRFAIDAVFVGADRRVTRTFASLRPWRIALGGRGARAVLELPLGAIETSDTRVGDLLDLEPV